MQGQFWTKKINAIAFAKYQKIMVNFGQKIEAIAFEKYRESAGSIWPES